MMEIELQTATDRNEALKFKRVIRDYRQKLKELEDALQCNQGSMKINEGFKYKPVNYAFQMGQQARDRRKRKKEQALMGMRESRAFDIMGNTNINESEWDAKTNTLTEVIDYDLYSMDCKSIANCKCVSRVISALRFYQTNVTKIGQNNDILSKYIEKYTDLLDDYAHIIDVHLNQDSSTSDSNFLLLNNIITQHIKCESIKTCAQFRRSRGAIHCNGNKSNSRSMKRKSDKTCQFYIELLETIHCFLIHSYHAGYRIKRASKIRSSSIRKSGYREQNRERGDSMFKSFEEKSNYTVNDESDEDNELMEIHSELKQISYKGDSNRKRVSKFSTDTSG